MIFLIIRTVAVEIIDRLYVVYRPMGILLPVVFSYGGVELLRVGETFHSRTKKAYASMNGLHKDSICFYEYYLKIPDYRVPKSCKLVDSVWSTVFDVFACLLAGDDEEVYWCCGRLADRSIVVMDGAGRYYHVEKGKRKRYIAANLPEPGEQDFDTAVKKLKEEAGQRGGGNGSAEEKERGSEKAEEAGGDKRCPSVPYGHEMGLETGGTYHRSSQIQKDSSSCGRLLCF